VAIGAAVGLLPWAALMTWLSIPLAWHVGRVVYTQAGRPLNRALAGTGQITLAFSVLFALGLLLVKLV
jgi:1,4-dihydroxy-2-naphthoate octaprenyltransferase